MCSVTPEGGTVADDSPSLRVPVGWAVTGLVAFLAVVNVVDIRVADASLVVGPVAAVGLLALARWAGLDWGELGLGRGTWRRGLVWGAVAIGAVAVVFVAGAALPATRGAFRDTRYDLSWPDALLKSLVLIPLGTILLEEVAFRGVLWGLICRARGAWTATAISSALFGLWHVLPSLGLATDNQAIGSAVGTGGAGRAISVLGTVLFTALSGVAIRLGPMALS